jgi:hypothetical protein
LPCPGAHKRPLRRATIPAMRHCSFFLGLIKGSTVSPETSVKRAHLHTSSFHSFVVMCERAHGHA